MKFFSIITLLLIAARLAFLFFPAAVPVEAANGLTWACVICGIIAGVFIGVEIYCKVTGKSQKK